MGPTDPMCSHIDAEPGPPLKRKVTGRVLLPLVSPCVYDTEYISPVSSPSSFLMAVVPAFAL